MINAIYLVIIITLTILNYKGGLVFMEAVELKELVADFLKGYFVEVDEINSFNIEFLQNNDFMDTKIDYLKLIRFLNTAIDNLKNLDPEILDDFLRKLHGDTSKLYEYYIAFDKNNKISEIIYRRDFLESIKPYRELKAEVEKTETLKNSYFSTMKATENQLSSMKPKTEAQIKEYKVLKRRNVDAISNYADSKETLQTLNRELIKFEEDSFEEFNRQFFDEKSYYLESLSKIINIKLFYLDKILWIEAQKSQSIQNFFERAQIKGDYSMKTFIEYYLRNINVSQSRSSDWHGYLQKCLELWSEDE